MSGIVYIIKTLEELKGLEYDDNRNIVYNNTVDQSSIYPTHFIIDINNGLNYIEDLIKYFEAWGLLEISQGELANSLYKSLITKSLYDICNSNDLQKWVYIDLYKKEILQKKVYLDDDYRALKTNIFNFIDYSKQLGY